MGVTEKFQEGPFDGTGVGDDAESWGTDGLRHMLWHDGESNGKWPRNWKEGDIIGLAIDIDACVMQFSLNGDWVEELLHTFEAAGRKFYPAMSTKGNVAM